MATDLRIRSLTALCEARDEEDAAPSGSDLCLSCGLCCNSGLFTHISLTQADRELLAANGLPAPKRIEQPCAFWANECTIYDLRPHPCREYRCELLANLQAGRVSLPTAIDRVRKTIELRNRFIDVLPDTRKVKEAAHDLNTEGPEKKDPAQLQALLDYAAYRLSVEQHFLAPAQSWMTRPPTSGEPSS
jgi:uncharacterized protein